MNNIHDLGWWYWLLTVGLLCLGLLGWPAGIWLAVTLCLIQIAHILWLNRNLTAFPVQVRGAYLGLLFAGLWGPLQWIHWMQIAGTTARILAGYCLLARALSLAPWNRRQPLTAGLLRRTFFSWHRTMTPCGQVFRGLALERIEG